MTIDFTEILPQNTPDVQVETDWTSGSAGLPNDNKTLLLMGQQLATGSLAVPTGSNVQVPRRITSTSQAIGLYGKGSNLAVMCEYALKAAPRATIYAVAYKAGSTPGAAAQTVTLASNASGSGELKVWIMGELFRTGIASGDTPTIVGDAIEAAINGHPNLPVTAANAAGTVTVTARTPGLEGNSIAIRSEITGGITMTSTDGAAYLASGTVAGDPSDQLAAIVGDRYHLIAIETADSTELAKLKSHQETASTPAQKRWGLGIAGIVDTAANAQTLGNALDSYRMQVVWQEASDRPNYVLAAAFAGLRANYGPKESLDSAVLPNIPAPYDESGWPNAGDVETNVTEGLVVLRPIRANGTSQIVRSVITRQTTPLTYRDHTIAEKSDYTDLAVIDGFSPFVGKVLKSASPPGLSGTITPRRAEAKLGRILRALDREDILQGVATAIAAGRVQAEINATEPTRLDCAFPYFPTQTAHTIMMRKTYETTSSL
jgi:phage tail sheath gpL-like